MLDRDTLKGPVGLSPRPGALNPAGRGGSPRWAGGRSCGAARRGALTADARQAAHYAGSCCGRGNAAALQGYSNDGYVSACGAGRQVDAAGGASPYLPLCSSGSR